MTRKILRTIPQLVFAGVTATGIAALTLWGSQVPVLQESALTADTVNAPAQDTVQVCTSDLENTIGAIDVSETVASTSITATDSAATVQVDGSKLENSSTVLEQADGVLITTSAVNGRSAGTASLTASMTTAGDLRSLTTATCVQPGSMSWIVGGSAAVGASAQLRLTNPGSTPVTVHVTLYGATGVLTLPSNGDIAVGPGETESLLLETSGGASDRIAVSIETDGGQVAAFLATEELDGETPAGAEILTSSATPDTEVLIPGVLLATPDLQGQTDPENPDAATSTDSPVVRVVNPNDTETTVSIFMIGPDGESALAGATDLPIDAGAVFDVTLDGLPAGAYGIRIVADQPVTAAAQLVRSAGEYPANSGRIVQDQTWVEAAQTELLNESYLPLPQLAGVKTKLLVTNGSDVAQELTIAAADGSWEESLTVAAGTSETLDLPETSAVKITGADAADVVAAGVAYRALSGEDGGIEGVLISSIPLTADVASASARKVVLR